MKILFPALHYPPVIGGIETWTKEIAERISQKAEIFVVTGRVVGQVRREVSGGLRIFRTSLLQLKNLSHSSLWYTLDLLPFIFFKSLRIIKKEKIALLHCQGFLSGFLGYYLSKLCRIPYIITVQSLQANKPLQRLKKKVYTNAKVCIAASSAIADYFRQIGVDKQRIVIIPNGIDISRFQGFDKQEARQEARQELCIEQDDFVIITVGRLDKRKGIEYLLQAVNNFQFPISNFQLLIIGDGSERKNLEELTKQLSLQNKVKFLGEVPNEKVPQYLSAGDCFCLCSTEEGFGIAVLEAMAAGIPVVASNVGGILDIIENNQTGILIEPKNPQAIVQAIQKICLQPGFKHNLIENTKAILPKYEWQDIAEKVFKIYEQHSKI